VERIEILLRTIADELHAEAEGDDVLVEGDGKEEEPDGALDSIWSIRFLGNCSKKLARLIITKKCC
jgi:hypothetical protein